MKEIREDLGRYQPHLRADGVGIWKWERKLALRSQPGVLRVGFWGCGSAFSQNQFQSNMVVIKGDTVVFVDLGTKTFLKLAEFGLGSHDVANLIVTHSHADHVGSLEELGLRRRYEAPILKALQEGFKFPPEGDGSIFKRANEIKTQGLCRTPIYVPKEYADELWSQTLSGGMAHSEEIDMGGPRGRMRMDHFFDLKTISKSKRDLGRLAWEFEIGTGPNRIHFLMYVTPHIPDTAKNLEENFFSAGLIMDGRVMISGDTRFDSDIFTGIGKNCETIFQDCQSFQGGVHASYQELCSLPAELKSKILIYHCDDGMRPLQGDGTLGSKDISAAGFAGYAKPAPVFYDWE